MSQNPFQIIRPSDQPPEHLKKEVIGSVKRIMLLMRFMQLFMSDFGMAFFENIKLVGRNDKDGSSRTEP
ncbi:MAG: hypothetical protein KA408_16210 [Flavobacteriales bacterium]|nr:hypothetical protein [Flavobacteriales bacterium]